MTVHEMGERHIPTKEKGGVADTEKRTEPNTGWSLACVGEAPSPNALLTHKRRSRLAMQLPNPMGFDDVMIFITANERVGTTMMDAARSFFFCFFFKKKKRRRLGSWR